MIKFSKEIEGKKCTKKCSMNILNAPIGVCSMMILHGDQYDPNYATTIVKNSTVSYQEAEDFVNNLKEELDASLKRWKEEN